jgi:predicted XRE-type DNA-binding protein
MSVKNAFTAFGLDADEATIDTLRTDIAFALREFIERSGKGQAKVGELLGLKQSVVSHIVRGDIGHLSVERLIRAMVKAGIPGFAEWGGSPEEARAGSGYRPSAVPAAVIVTRNLDVPGIAWSDAKAANAGRTAAQLVKPTGTSVAKLNKVN